MLRVIAFLATCFLLSFAFQDQIEQKTFLHGVASGDPLPDRVVIWTRVSSEVEKEVEVNWKMSSNEAMTQIVQSGKLMTNSNKDFTVKTDVTGLEANTKYYYQFEALDEKSPIGKTKTAASQSPEEVKLAIVSCSNYEAGFFNAYSRIAEREDLDAVIHLGDYFYEYAVGGYGDTSLGRLNLPVGELLSLDDYRTRYSLYRQDADLQKVHQAHPFITIWDDHEIANNAYLHGAENHQEGEGDYYKRAAAAKQAYYEWLPIRETTPLHYRKFQYGNLLDLIMLDERLAGRTAPVDSVDAPNYYDENRAILGDKQLNWFLDNLKNSKASWKVIGNQVLFSNLDMKAANPNWPINLDAWDGYPAERNKIVQFLQQEDIQNLIFVTGDTHRSWAFEAASSMKDYRENEAEAVVAVEFGTTSITSSNSDEGTTMDTVLMGEQVLLKTNPHLKYLNAHDHGYLLLSLTQEEAIAEWHFVETVKKPSEKEFLGKKIRVKSGNYKLEEIEE